jgi:hypothetical protein
VADYDPKARRARPTPAADEPAAVDALLEVVEHAHDPLPQDANGSRSAVSESASGSTTAQAQPDDAPGDAPAAAPVDVPTGAVTSDPVVPANPWVSSVPEPAGGKGRLVVMALAALAAVVVVLTLLRRRRS